MIASVDAFRLGRIELRTLVADLEALLRAIDLHDRRLLDEWWQHATPIAMQLELPTGDPAYEGTASINALDRALSDFRTWTCSVLDATDPERT